MLRTAGCRPHSSFAALTSSSHVCASRRLRFDAFEETPGGMGATCHKGALLVWKGFALSVNRVTAALRSQQNVSQRRAHGPITVLTMALTLTACVVAATSSGISQITIGLHTPLHSPALGAVTDVVGFGHAGAPPLAAVRSSKSDSDRIYIPAAAQCCAACRFEIDTCPTSNSALPAAPSRRLKPARAPF
jgi:hypothetical protein